MKPVRLKRSSEGGFMAQGMAQQGRCYRGSYGDNRSKCRTGNRLCSDCRVGMSCMAKSALLQEQEAEVDAGNRAGTRLAARNCRGGMYPSTRAVAVQRPRPEAGLFMPDRQTVAAWPFVCGDGHGEWEHRLPHRLPPWATQPGERPGLFATHTNGQPGIREHDVCVQLMTTVLQRSRVSGDD
jgi:hypothetical protein